MKRIFLRKIIGFICIVIAAFALSNAAYASTLDEKESDEDFYSVEAIKNACDGRATVQDDRQACIVKLDDHNPYDVIWDYGDLFQQYVDKCNWNLVFDAEYYKSSYPMLAILYNQDDALLLEHFQTVGVHEGRQGNVEFNVEAYLNNCDYQVYKAFKGDVEGAYIYYMLHYDTEAFVNTTSCKDGSRPRTQLFNLYTILQQTELNHINKYRLDAGSEDVTLNGELCALANYRAYINRINGVEYGHAHDWLKNNQDTAWEYIGYITSNAKTLGENAITYHKGLINKDFACMYYCSKKHRECMVNNVYSMVGVSNVYESPDTGLESQIDLFIALE